LYFWFYRTVFFFRLPTPAEIIGHVSTDRLLVKSIVLKNQSNRQHCF